MAEHGNHFPLYQFSNTSEDVSSDHNTLSTNGDHGGASGRSCTHHHKPPPSFSVGNHNQVVPPPQKRPRGRPAGSKNKPKPPIVITQDHEDSLKSVVIKVGIGFDVMETLVEFARKRNVGITVLNGSGSVASVTLNQPLLSPPPYTIHGPFTLLSFSGTYFCGPSRPSIPSFTLMDATSSSSASALNPNNCPACSITTSSFGISLLGSEGQIYGGIVAGKIMAASIVTITVTVFKNPEIYKVGINDNDEDGGVGEKDHNNLNANGNGTMSKFMNNLASYNVNQWGHIHNSRIPRN